MAKVVEEMETLEMLYRKTRGWVGVGRGWLGWGLGWVGLVGCFLRSFFFGSLRWVVKVTRFVGVSEGVGLGSMTFLSGAAFKGFAIGG